MIRSKIEYAGFLISPCKEKLFYDLQKIQNLAIRLALGCMPSTPINVLHAESKIPLLEYRFELLCFRYLIRNLAIKK